MQHRSGVKRGNREQRTPEQGGFASRGFGESPPFAARYFDSPFYGLVGTAHMARDTVPEY
jgi:hypothetical protein